MTTPMTESEARAVSDFIDAILPGVSSGVCRPGETLRLAWDRASVELFVAALVAHRTNDNHVPHFIVDNLRYWLDNIADPEEDEDPDNR